VEKSFEQKGRRKAFKFPGSKTCLLIKQAPTPMTLEKKPLLDPPTTVP